MQEEQKAIVVNKNGPIIIIEDDADDQEFLSEIFKKLNYKNEVRFFFDGQEALDSLSDFVQIFPGSSSSPSSNFASA